MANGILLPPGLRGYVAAEQMAQQRAANQLNQVTGVLALQQAMRQQAFEEQTEPLRLEIMRRQLNPAPRFGNVDPKDYTQESVASFIKSGNHADLVPVRKREAVTTTGMSGEPVTQFIDPYNPSATVLPQPIRREMVNTGGAIQPVNPYTQNAPLGTTFTPGDRARLGLEGQKMWWETGFSPSIPGINIPQPPARDGALPPKDIAGATTNLRKEFNSLPEVQNFRAAVPLLRSATNAPDTAAGDLDIIYAVGKALDPGSVVREGEMSLVIKAGSPAQRFSGMASNVMGGGRLPPEQRRDLLNMLNGRVGELKTFYDQAQSTYSQVARRQGLRDADIFIESPELPKPTQRPAFPQRPAPTGVDPAVWNVMTPEERRLWQR